LALFNLADTSKDGSVSNEEWGVYAVEGLPSATEPEREKVF